MKAKITISNVFKVLVVGFFVICCYLSSKSYAYFLNSDATISAAMGQDIASGNVFLKGWFLCTASYYFTDLIPHGLVYFFVRNMRDTTSITAIILCCLLFASGYLIYKQIVKEKTNILLYFGAGLVYLAASFAQLMSSPYHIATVAYCLLALYFYFSSFYGAKMLFTLFAAMALVSDNYSIVYLVLPLIGENIIYFIKTHQVDKKIIYVFISLFLAFLFKILMQNIGYIVPGIAINFVSKEQFSDNLAYLFWGPLEYFDSNFWGQTITFNVGLLWTLFTSGFCMALLCVQIWGFCYYKFTNRIVTILLLASLFIFGAMAITSLARTPRYYLGSIFNGFILLCLFISHLNISKKMALFIGALFLLLGSRHIVDGYVHRQDINNTPETEVVKLIDENNLKYGVAAYWNSYNLNHVFNDNRMMAILPSGQMMAWLTKEKWYDRPVDFVLVNKSADETQEGHFLPLETIYRLGKVKQEIETQEYKLFIFETPIVINKKSYKGSELLSSISSQELSDGVVVAENTSAGFLTYGPYIFMSQGSYKVILDYEAQNAEGSYFEVVAGEENTVLARKYITEHKTELSLDLKIDINFFNVEFRTFYAGEGVLKVKNIKFEKQN